MESMCLLSCFFFSGSSRGHRFCAFSAYGLFVTLRTIACSFDLSIDSSTHDDEVSNAHEKKDFFSGIFVSGVLRGEEGAFAGAVEDGAAGLRYFIKREGDYFAVGFYYLAESCARSVGKENKGCSFPSDADSVLMCMYVCMYLCR